jgi:hypothetical protein
VKISGQLVDQALLDAVLVKLLLDALPDKDRPQGLNKIDPMRKAKAIEQIKADPIRWTVEALMCEFEISQGTAAAWKRDSGVQ